jgi:hypothetical protein
LKNWEFQALALSMLLLVAVAVYSFKKYPGDIGLTLRKGLTLVAALALTISLIYGVTGSIHGESFSESAQRPVKWMIKGFARVFVLGLK